MQADLVLFGAWQLASLQWMMQNRRLELNCILGDEMARPSERSPPGSISAEVLCSCRRTAVLRKFSKPLMGWKLQCSPTLRNLLCSQV